MTEEERPVSEVIDKVLQAGEAASAADLALAMATPKDLICATGSLFVVAEVMEYMGKLT